MRTLLQHVAHVRSGDKGDISNVVVVAYSQALYAPLKRQLTTELMRERYAGLVTGAVQRFCVDQLWVINFLLHDALGGGVSRSLRLDQYGKTMAAAALGIELEIPPELEPELRGVYTDELRL
jgi:hypothetical protein